MGSLPDHVRQESGVTKDQSVSPGRWLDNARRLTTSLAFPGVRIRSWHPQGKTTRQVSKGQVMEHAPKGPQFLPILPEKEKEARKVTEEVAR